MGWRREPRRWAGGAGFAEGCDDWGVVGGWTDHVPRPGRGPGALEAAVKAGESRGAGRRG